MLIREKQGAVLVDAPAKVNLYLEVLRRREDGYHELATLMVAVSLFDTLEFQDDPTGAVRLVCDQPTLTTGPDNLIHKAVALLRQQHAIQRGVSIALEKRIPMAAGLAGGSSDAAATLVGLNRLWNLGLDPPELARLAAQLGSDCAFFLDPPAAWCTGRGEKVESLKLVRPLIFVLVKPAQGLSTAEVFRNLRVPDEPEDGQAMREALKAGEVEKIGRCLHNRLQPVAERLCPAVAVWTKRLADLGPAGQLMSGSGTTVFALCRDDAEALRIERGVLRFREEKEPPRVCIVRSCI